MVLKNSRHSDEGRGIGLKGSGISSGHGRMLFFKVYTRNRFQSANVSNRVMIWTVWVFFFSRAMDNFCYDIELGSDKEIVLT